MRHSLTIMIASVGLMAAGLAGPALAGPADTDIDTTRASVVASEAAPAQQRRAPMERDLHDKVVKKRGKLYFQGRVDPGHGPVFIQKKTCAKKSCKWKAYKRVKTQGPKERWSVRIHAPKKGNWYWRGYVKASGQYATSWTSVWKTYTL